MGLIHAEIDFSIPVIIVDAEVPVGVLKSPGRFLLEIKSRLQERNKMVGEAGFKIPSKFIQGIQEIPTNIKSVECIISP